MTRSKCLIHSLGLCSLLFALMGIVVSGAQAASWLVLEGANVVEKGEITLEDETTIIVHSKVSGISVLFECSTVATSSANLEAGGKVAKGAKVKFSGCLTKVNGTTSVPCEPNAGGVEKGVIASKLGHAAIVEERIEVAPDEGETFATIEMGKECSIGTKIPLIGKLILKDCENAFLTHQERHLLEVESTTSMWVISKTEEHKASLLGSVWAKVKLNGVFRSFAGHAA